MSVVSALAAGAALGLRHSLEADHVAAIATLVDDEATDRPGFVGTSWGIGHALPIVLVGGLFIALGTRLPTVVSTLFEVLAGVVLVALGVRVLYGLLDVTEHDHGGHSHRHLAVGPLSVGATHSHREGESFLVGIVHGLAGSGALVVLLVSTAPTVAAGASFLGAFAIASILTMGVLSALWGRLLSTGASRALQAAAGVVSIAIGAALLAGELLGGLSRGHGHDHGGGHDHEHALALVDVAGGALEVVLSVPSLF